ncbi:hypothetical protein PGT21_005882 [Puccinia graminis f. sp. tritici]|uniref:Uncharacterized protein n=1 Tax=Puccinia graminis f. sp. tritici TaxID=56615 RepID=A0A5B0MC88_PUCGR|nr:hypothetical protein PGT21_005882 [Puccinia graminis f. sp. tritici]
MGHGGDIARPPASHRMKLLEKYQIHTLEISFGLGVHILKSGPKVHLVLKRGLAKDQGNVSSKQSFAILLLTNWMTLTQCDLEIGKHSEWMFLRAYDVPKVTLSTCDARERIRPLAENSKEHFPKPEDGKQRPVGGNHCDSLITVLGDQYASLLKFGSKGQTLPTLSEARFPEFGALGSKLGCVRAAGHVMAPERLSTAIGLDGDSLRLSEHYIMALILCQRPQDCAS